MMRTRIAGRMRGTVCGLALLAWLIAPLSAWAQDGAATTAAPEAPQTATPTQATQPAAPTTAPQEDAAAEATPVVAWLELSGPLREGPVPFAWVPEEEAEPSLQQVVRQIERVGESEQYLGMVIYLDRPELTLTQIDALADAITQARAAGKRVLTFSEQYDLRTYLLASSADLILLQHRGAVELSGLAIEELYLAGLLDKVGVRADLMQVGQFKGADEPLTRTGPTEAWNQNMSALLDDLYAQIIGRIAKGRSLTPEAVEQMIADSWTMTDADYLRRRVVDRLTDRDLISVTEVEFGDTFVWDDVIGEDRSLTAQRVDSPFALFRMLFQEPASTTTRASIAVIHAYGPITSGESAMGDGLFSSDRIGSRTFVELLGDAAADPHIKGAVIRIDSPGGSALASEVIWQAVRQLAEEKPVFVSIDNLAASGGYYIASAADRIYVAPQSIVGSIGVVGGKIILGGLYEKIGVTVHRRSRGPLSDMFNSVEPFTPEQRQIVHTSMQRIYEQFTDRVKIGRGSRLTDINQVAEGRLFTGKQAVGNGLADELGNLDQSVADLAAQLDLKEGEYDIVNMPPAMSLAEFLNSIFGAQGGAPDAQLTGLAAAAREALGPQAWTAARRVLTGLMMLRQEPALTLMPTAIVVR